MKLLNTQYQKVIDSSLKNSNGKTPTKTLLANSLRICYTRSTISGIYVSSLPTIQNKTYHRYKRKLEVVKFIS